MPAHPRAHAWRGRHCGCASASQQWDPYSSCCSIRPLPARLEHARNFALQRQAAETDAAHLELAQVTAGPAADAAAVARPDLVLELLAHLCELTGSRHRFSP